MRAYSPQQELLILPVLLCLTALQTSVSFPDARPVSSACHIPATGRTLLLKAASWPAEAIYTETHQLHTDVLQ